VTNKGDFATNYGMLMFTRPFKLGDNVESYMPVWGGGDDLQYYKFGNLRYKNNNLNITFTAGDLNGTNISNNNWFIGTVYQVLKNVDSCQNKTVEANDPNCGLGGQIIEVKNKDDDQLIKKFNFNPPIVPDSDDNSVSLFKNSLKSNYQKDFSRNNNVFYDFT
jgi:hypothetical protein